MLLLLLLFILFICVQNESHLSINGLEAKMWTTFGK